MKSSIGANKVIKKATNIMLDILIFTLGIILLISIYNVMQVKILGNDYSSFFGYTMFEVQTGSMEPEISAGDWIIVKEQKSFELDDVVTFKQGENFITHRIIEKYSDTYITQGDANNREDDPINYSQIVGEVVTVIPFFGILRITILNPLVIIALILTIVIFNSKKIDKGGIDKVINKIKEFFKKITRKKEEESFFKDNQEKSFENVATKPTFESYRERLENYSSKELDKEEEIEEKEIEDIDKEEELSKTMFFRMVSVDEEENKIEEDQEDIKSEEIQKQIETPINEETDVEEEQPGEEGEKIYINEDEFYILPKETNEEDKEMEFEEDSENSNDILVEDNIKVQEEIPGEDIPSSMSIDSFIISTDDDYVAQEQEIKENEEKQEEIEKETPKPVKEEVKEEPKEENSEDEAKFTLEMIFNKPEHKKSKNIIARTMAIKEEEINKTIDLIFGESKPLTNEATIKKSLIKSYLESKYYNIFSEKVAMLENKKSAAKKPRYAVLGTLGLISEKNGFNKTYVTRAKKVITRLSYALEEDSINLAKVYSGNDKSYDDKLEKYSSLIILIAKLEYLVDLPINMKNKKILYTKEIIKFISDYNIDNENIEYTVKEVIHSQKHYRTASKYFLDRLNTEMFELIYNSFKTDKAKFLIDLKHNINFSQVYSEKVVDKAYAEGIVAEDKLNVLLTLLQARLSHDMLTGEFVNEYAVLVPDSLCLKESKFEKLFKLNNEEYAKKNIVYMISYDMFMKKASTIKTLRKSGFRIAMYINNETKFSSKNKTGIALAEYIIIDKQTNKIIDLEKVVFDNFKDKIIKEDIESKLEIRKES